MGPAALLDNLTWAMIRFGLILFAALICIILLLIHTLQYIKSRIRLIKSKTDCVPQSNSLNQSKIKIQQIIGIMTLIMIFLFAISPISIAVSEILVFLNIKHPNDRLIFVQIATCFFRGGKCFMYLIFTLKLHFLYGGTMYEYKISTLRIFAILIIISTIAWLIVIPGAVKMEYTEHDIPWNNGNSDYNKIYRFSTYFDGIVVILAAINELISWMVLIYAFLKPLRKLMKAVIVDDESNQEFRSSAIKATILTLSSVISSIFSYIFIVLFKVAIITNSFDMPFNCICVMFMNPYYDKAYSILCCGIIKCTDCCNKNRNNGHDNELNMEQIVVNVPTGTGTPRTVLSPTTENESVAPSTTDFQFSTTEITETNGNTDGNV